MKKKAAFYFVLWVVFLLIVSLISATMLILSYLQTGRTTYTLYIDYQKSLLLLLTPICLVPMLCCSCYYAIKEKNKKIKIASMCLIIQHITCLIALFLQ